MQDLILDMITQDNTTLEKSMSHAWLEKLLALEFDGVVLVHIANLGIMAVAGHGTVEHARGVWHRVEPVPGVGGAGEHLFGAGVEGSDMAVVA